MASLFGRSALAERAQQIKTEDILEHVALVQTWLDDYETGSLKKDKETAREQQYNADFFGSILGYRSKPANPYTFEPKDTTEKKQYPDAVLRYTDAEKAINNIAAVVELKGASINLDKPQQREGNMSPVQQAFKYKPQYRSCPFVVVSNFFEFRLYNDNQLDFESWTLRQLVDPADDYLNFKKWFVLLHVDNMTAPQGKSPTEKLLSDIRTKQLDVGKDFYAKYSSIRTELLQDVWRKNPKTRFQFSVAIQKVQTIIDRVMFACFAEDSGLLPDNTLERVASSAENSAYTESLWEELKLFFTMVDKGSGKLGIPNGYNGGMFADDPLVNSLDISDAPLKRLIELGQYDFKEDLRVNILGHVFEQSITDLEEIKRKVQNDNNPFDPAIEPPAKSGKRKKQGIFYTPDFIVRYVVDNSLGAHLREQEDALKKKHNLAGMRTEKGYDLREKAAYTEYQHILQNVKVLDPACGSGAFLVYVFDYLLAENKRVDDILGGGLYSSEDYVRSILGDNIYGVDLNEESVEITKLSLWLKTAEKGKQLTALDENIKCGNTLINDQVAGEKSFDWHAEFAAIFETGGFDVVVGNPPYVRVQNLVSDEVDYYFDAYETPSGKLDISILFFEKALQLVKDDGRLAFISSSQWMQTDYGRKLRALLAQGYVSEIVDFGSLPVFQDADTYPAIFTISKTTQESLAYSRIATVDQLNNSSIMAAKRKPIDYAKLDSSAWQFGEFNLVESLQERKIPFVPFIELGHAYVGDISGRAETFVVTKSEAAEKGLESELLYPYAYRNNEVFRYARVKPDAVVIYPYEPGPNGEARLIPEAVLEEKYPNIHAHLLKDKEVLRTRQDTRKLYANGPDWYRHLRAGSFNYIEPPKLIFKGIDKRAVVGFIEGETAFNGTNCTGVIIEDGSYSSDYILGILNSKLCSHYLNAVCPPKLSNTFRYNTNNINRIPIIEKTNPAVEELVRQMVALKEELDTQSDRFRSLIVDEYSLASWPQKFTRWWDFDFKEFVRAGKIKVTLVQKDELLTFWTGYQKTCSELDIRLAAIDSEIDSLVYGIYGLDAAEIEIVESKIGKTSDES